LQQVKNKQIKWTFFQLVCLPYPHLLPRFSLVSGGHHGFFQTIGFGNLRCLTFELAYVNLKKGENFYESILNVLIPKGIRFLLKLDNKAFFKNLQFTFHLNLHLEITALNKETQDG
jgi:hypothetical protein